MIHHHTTHRLLENHLWLTGANHLTERERDAFSRLSLGLQKKNGSGSHRLGGGGIWPRA